MSDQIQQLQSQVNALKIRAFDLGEQIQGQQAQLQEFSEVLSEVAKIAGVQADENGNVQLTDLVQAVSALANPVTQTVESVQGELVA